MKRAAFSPINRSIEATGPGFRDGSSFAIPSNPAINIRQLLFFVLSSFNHLDGRIGVFTPLRSARTRRIIRRKVRKKTTLKNGVISRNWVLVFKETRVWMRGREVSEKCPGLACWYIGALSIRNRNVSSLWLSILSNSFFFLSLLFYLWGFFLFLSLVFGKDGKVWFFPFLSLSYWLKAGIFFSLVYGESRIDDNKEWCWMPQRAEWTTNNSFPFHFCLGKGREIRRERRRDCLVHIGYRSGILVTNTHWQERKRIRESKSGKGDTIQT